MKSTTLNFISTFAILSICISIAAHAGILNRTKLAVAAGPCYRDVVVGQGASCTSFPLLEGSTLTCTDASTKLNLGVKSFNAGTSIPENQIPVMCVDGELFCCAQLKEVSFTFPCAIVIGGKHYAIDAIWCKD